MAYRFLAGTTGSTKIPFIIFYVEKPKIISSLSEFGRIAYITEREKIKNQMTDKTYKAIMVEYSENHMRDTLKIYNTETRGSSRKGMLSGRNGK